MDRHLSVLAAFYIAYSAVSLLVGLFLFVVISGGGMLSGNVQSIAITSTVAVFVASFFTITAVPGLIGGAGLLKRKSWARILVLILAVLHLLDLPIGTALGIYTLWVLTRPEAVALLEDRPAA